MASKRALAHFRELCWLGLPPDAFGVALVDALHEIVPSLHNRIVWHDPQRRVMTGMYCESDEMYARGSIFFEHFDNQLPDFPGTRFAWNCPPGAGHYRPFVSTPRYFAGAYHNEIERPAGGHHFMDMLIGDHAGPRALVLLTREARAPAFSDAEIAQLQRLVPYAAYGLRAAAAPTPLAGAGDADACGEPALVIAGLDGRVRQSTPQALQWLAMAFRPPAEQRTLETQLKRDLPEPVIALCRALDRAALGQAPPPDVLTVDNAFGRFRVQASLLRGPAEGARVDEPQAAISVQWQPLRLLSRARALRQLGLSPGQMKVCLALLDSHRTEAELASHLGLQPSTVHDHVRKAYRKLGVHSREGLLRSLDAATAST
jgi:DNA-binding CsgD family transcriptional regulator